MMLVPYSRKNHSVYNPFQDFDDLEKAFFSDRSLGELKTDIKDLGESYALEAAVDKSGTLLLLVSKP